MIAPIMIPSWLTSGIHEQRNMYIANTSRLTMTSDEFSSSLKIVERITGKTPIHIKTGINIDTAMSCEFCLDDKFRMLVQYFFEDGSSYSMSYFSIMHNHHFFG